MSTPVILGGKPILNSPIEDYRTIGREEEVAALKVIRSGKLSGFIGANCKEFLGGREVQRLECSWSDYFNIKYSVSMNSATSCLYSSIAAIGIEPGDEIIVTPTTMTATVTGIVLFQGIPIFCDINPNTYCIDVNCIKKLITSRTKAIIGVDIYGYTADWFEIIELARKNGILTIEDSAQSIGGTYKGKKSGTLADIGIYSLNRHKHIHCGEGGVCVTNNEELANRLRLIRNHGEAVINTNDRQELKNIIGFNFRMTEIEAAIANEQLKKLDKLVFQRQAICQEIINIYKKFSLFGLPPEIDIDAPTFERIDHVYYYLCFKLDFATIGLSRSSFVKAINAEGFPHGEGGYKPIYMQPMFQNRVAFGSRGYPFTLSHDPEQLSYSMGICPNAEKMWFDNMFYFKIQNYIPTMSQVNKLSNAIERIISYRNEIEEKFSKKETIS